MDFSIYIESIVQSQDWTEGTMLNRSDFDSFVDYTDYFTKSFEFFKNAVRVGAYEEIRIRCEVFNKLVCIRIYMGNDGKVRFQES